MIVNRNRDWEERIDRISCFQELIEQEEKSVLQSETSIGRITALQNAIEQEEQVILNRDTGSMLSLITLKPMRSRQMQNITILAPDIQVNTVIIPAIKRLTKTTNDYLFEIKSSAISEIPNDVDFSLFYFKHPSENYIHETLLETEFNLYASPAYLEKYGEPKETEDLNQHTIIGLQKSDLTHQFNKGSYNPIFYKRECMRVDSRTSLLAMGEQGLPGDVRCRRADARARLSGAPDPAVLIGRDLPCWSEFRSD